MQTFFEPPFELRRVEKFDSNYPPLLWQLPDAPNALNILGAYNPHDTCIAIVGTRHPSVRGVETAHKFAYELAKVGFTIVSGLAYGIDTAAHEGALAATGKTIAVLGSGLKQISPRANITLAEKIIETGGAVFSEYDENETGAKYHFIERNRIIAGMCVATIVIEAPQKSGALFTADFALEYNREVFAVPGSLYSENSTGTNNLIKKGAAQLITSTADVVEILGFNKQLSIPM